jgi:hypothetical protein
VVGFGDNAVALGDGGVDDETQQATRIPMAMTMGSIASRRRRWGRLEGEAASGDDGCVDLWCVCSKGRHQQDLQSEEERTRPERGLGIPGLCRNRRFTAVGTADSGEQFRQPGGAIRRERRGRKERESRATYRRGRGAELLRQ